MKPFQVISKPMQIGNQQSQFKRCCLLIWHLKAQKHVWRQRGDFSSPFPASSHLYCSSKIAYILVSKESDHSPVQDSFSLIASFRTSRYRWHAPVTPLRVAKRRIGNTLFFNNTTFFPSVSFSCFSSRTFRKLWNDRGHSYRSKGNLETVLTPSCSRTHSSCF